MSKLAAAIDRNARLIEENRPDAVVNTSLLWARAIDLGQAWMRAAEWCSMSTVLRPSPTRMVTMATGARPETVGRQCSRQPSPDARARAGPTKPQS